jgi:hypothetical protein
MQGTTLPPKSMYTSDELNNLLNPVPEVGIPTPVLGKV